MKSVRIAELKSRLSEYLRAVRRGETIAVLDRETPVAQIVPVRNRATTVARVGYIVANLVYRPIYQRCVGLGPTGSRNRRPRQRDGQHDRNLPAFSRRCS